MSPNLDALVVVVVVSADEGAAADASAVEPGELAIVRSASNYVVCAEWTAARVEWIECHS